MSVNRVGRPVTCRSIYERPKITCFMPEGVSRDGMQGMVLSFDELEAIRLADKEGSYHADAAVKMNVSRATFGRILESARQKVAEALVDGKKICIHGGVIKALCDTHLTDRDDICICPECSAELPHTKGEPCRESACPQCGAILKRKGGCQSG